MGEKFHHLAKNLSAISDDAFYLTKMTFMTDRAEGSYNWKIENIEIFGKDMTAHRI